MEISAEILPIGGAMLIFIGGLIAVNKEIAKRPTFKEMEDKYTEQKVCNEVRKSMNEKLECIPSIKKTITRIATKMGIEED